MLRGHFKSGPEFGEAGAHAVVEAAGPRDLLVPVCVFQRGLEGVNEIRGLCEWNPVTTGVEPSASSCDADGDGATDPGAPSGCTTGSTETTSTTTTVDQSTPPPTEYSVQRNKKRSAGSKKKKPASKKKS
jgi:hypothetical protein